MQQNQAEEWAEIQIPHLIPTCVTAGVLRLNVLFRVVQMWSEITDDLSK